MKKIFIVILLALISIIASGCTFDNSADKLKNIKYEVIYTGFTYFDGTAENMPPLTTYVFSSEEEWVNFDSKYQIGANSLMTMNQTIDFNKHSLIYTATIGAKPSYTTSATVDKYVIENDELKPIYGEDKNQNYAVNGDGVVHLFVIISLVEKDNLPNNLQNIYTQDN